MILSLFDFLTDRDAMEKGVKYIRVKVLEDKIITGCDKKLFE